MKTIRYIFILIIFLSLGCLNNTSQPPLEKETLPNHEGEIKIRGAYALMPLVQQWINVYQKINPEVLFNLSASATAEALPEMFSGQIDLVMSSSQLPETLDAMAWVLPVAKLSAVMVVNKENPYYSQIMETGLKKDDLTKLFTGEITSWGQLFGEAEKYPVSVFYRSDEAGASEVLSKYLWLDDQKMKGTGVIGDNQLIEAIKSDPLAIGYCNFIYAFNPVSKEFLGEIGIIPLDQNHNGRLDLKERFYKDFEELQRAMWLGRYPCILNRPLTFIARQKPATKELYDFLKWITTDGQKIITEMGYMELHSGELPPCL